MAGAPKPPRHRGRFDATMDDSALLEAVGAILRHVNPARPQDVKQRAFDAARSDAGYPQCPTARAITMRLNRRATQKLSWSDITELASNEDRSFTQTLVAAEREAPSDHLDNRHVYFALRFIAQRAGLAAPTRDQYAAERAKLLAARRRRKDETLTPLLPTVGQIERLFDGDWNGALTHADLERPAYKPVPPPRTKGLPLDEATAHFVKANGWWPTQKALEEFCKRANAKLAGIREPAADTRVKASAMLSAEGIAVPEEQGPPRDAKTRTIVVPPGGIPGAPARNADREWNESACVDALARWLAQMPTSAKTTKAAYMGFQRGKPDFPAPSAFDEHGGFARVKAEARKALARRSEPSPDADEDFPF